MIRKAEEKDLKELTAMYKKVFPVHNIFTLGEAKIIDYLGKFIENILIAEDNGKIVGALAVFKRRYTSNWTLFNFKHVAVLHEYQRKGIGSDLLKEAEKLVSHGKIEIRVAEGEGEAEAPWAVEFYEKNGYEKEGELKSHYREGEICFIMGKVVG